MAEEYFPFDSGAGANNTEARWVKMARLFAPDGVALAYGTGLPYGDSSGMQVKLGACVIWGNGQYYENTATITRAIENNSSGDPRIDLIVCGFNRTANTVSVYAVAGEPDVSPEAPTPTQTSAVYEIPLAYVAVASGAVTISAANVTDARAISSGIDGASGTIVKLGETVLVSGNTLLCDYSSIPQTFRHLELVITGRAAGAATGLGVIFQVNATGGTIYDYVTLVAESSSTTVVTTNNQAEGRISAVPGSTAGANIVGSSVTRFYDYADTTFLKIAESNGSFDRGNAAVLDNIRNTINLTAAINRIQVNEDTGSQFVAGSRSQLYGIR